MTENSPNSAKSKTLLNPQTLQHVGCDPLTLILPKANKFVENKWTLYMSCNSILVFGRFFGRFFGQWMVIGCTSERIRIDANRPQTNIINTTLPNVRPRSTESANSSERCPSHDSNSSENGNSGNPVGSMSLSVGHPMLSTPHNATVPTLPQNLAAHPPSMEAYLHMVAAAAQQYGFPLGAAAGSGPRLPLSLPTEASAPFKLPPQASPNASSNNSEALDFRTNLFGRTPSAEPGASEEEEEEEETVDSNNPLDLSVGTRKRSAETDNTRESTTSQMHIKKVFKTESSPLVAPATVTSTPLIPSVNPYLAAVAAANIFRTGQFPDWNGKSDLVVDPLEKMSDIVKGPRKEKSPRTASLPPSTGQATTGSTNTLSASTEGMSKARHNIWQSHWQNKGVASSVFRCVWCKQSFPTLDALTAHMKDSKHCGVNVPPFGNLPNTDRHHQPHQAQSGAAHHSHNLRKSSAGGNASAQQSTSHSPSAAAKNAFQYRGDPPTPLPRKLVRGQNVWLGKGVEQAMQILKCMRCGESFRSLGEMTKHMQETQHYTNILSQEQTISMKSSHESKESQNSMSSEESRTLSAVLTCKVCDKAFNSLGDLSNHMAKNNHYAEPLMQSMAGGIGNRKRPAPKKREKSLPVRKLLEMKGAQNEPLDVMEAKMQRNYENAKRISMENTGGGSGAVAANDKMEAVIFAERMRQYISGMKTSEENTKSSMNPASLLTKAKSPELEPKNGANKLGTTGGSGSSSVLSAIEQMFTTSFDTPSRHTNLPAASPSSSSNKNTSPVASSILKRLGIDETVDYNKPLMDTSDPYYQHYRYTSSERSGSECSIDNHLETHKLDAPTPEKQLQQPGPESFNADEKEVAIKKEPEVDKSHCSATNGSAGDVQQQTCVKVEIKSEIDDHETGSPHTSIQPENVTKTPNGTEYSKSSNSNYNKERSVAPLKSVTLPSETLGPRSPTESLRSATPKSPASSIKSYDEEKKYPSDSLNALSSMFDSLGSSASSTPNSRPQQPPLALVGKVDSPENLSTSNSLAALRQFCVKKEKTA